MFNNKYTCEYTCECDKYMCEFQGLCLKFCLNEKQTLGYHIMENDRSKQT